ncbi:DUF6968 family protein [Streptacidiphilus sp. PAMC 29251]
MVDSEIGPVAASRSIWAVWPDGRGSTFSVQLGTPFHDAGMAAWACPCRIEGLDDSRVYRMFGVDSLQALVIATDMLRRQLTAAAEEHGLTFTWGDGGESLALADILW